MNEGKWDDVQASSPTNYVSNERAQDIFLRLLFIYSDPTTGLGERKIEEYLFSRQTWYHPSERQSFA